MNPERRKNIEEKNQRYKVATNSRFCSGCGVGVGELHQSDCFVMKNWIDQELRETTGKHKYREPNMEGFDRFGSNFGY